MSVYEKDLEAELYSQVLKAFRMHPEWIKLMEIGEILGVSWKELILTINRLLEGREIDIDRGISAEELKRICRVGQRLSEMEDLDALIEQTLKILKEDFSYGHGVIYLKEGDYLVVRGLTEEEGVLEEGDKLRISEERVIGWVAQYEEPKLEDRGSELAVPIRKGAESFGVLSVAADERRFSEADKRVLQLVADQMALCINNIECKAEAKAISAKLEYKGKLLKMIKEGTELDRLMEVILEQGIKLIQTEAGGFLLLSEGEDAFEFKAAVGWELEKLKGIKLSRGELGLERRATIVSKGMLKPGQGDRLEDKFVAAIGSSPASSLFLSVEREGEIIGCISFHKGEGEFDLKDLNRVWSLMPEIELVIERAKDQEELRKMNSGALQ